MTRLRRHAAVHRPEPGTPGGLSSRYRGRNMPRVAPDRLHISSLPFLTLLLFLCYHRQRSGQARSLLAGRFPAERGFSPAIGARGDNWEGGESL
jgi:hypothetical protein